MDGWMGVLIAFCAGMAGGRLGAWSALLHRNAPGAGERLPPQGVDERALRMQMGELLVLVREAPPYEVAMLAVQLELAAARLHMLRSLN